MDKAPNAAPAFLQLMAVVAEVGGGALLIVGLLTPIATFLIACDMAGALARSSAARGSVRLPDWRPAPLTSGRSSTWRCPSA